MDGTCPTNIRKKVKVKVARSCPTLCDPMDLPVQGMLQARILAWVAIPFSQIRKMLFEIVIE